MDEQQTLPARLAGLPLRAVRVDVTEGPDRGQSHLSSADTITVGTADGNDLKLTDPTISRYHLELQRKGDRVLVVDHGSTNGIGLEGALIQRALVAAGTVLKVGRSALRVEDGRTVTVELQQEDALGELKGRSPLMRRLMARIKRVAATDVAVLVVGESGAGKELTARAIHDVSPRASGPFVTVDCGALAPTLVQSELFGHEKGAFTGADRRHVGAFERAQGGTLFLDEVGELPASIQAALLGVLERRRFPRVGGSGEVSVDVRIVSATNRDMRADVNAGTFRLDLFYRLAVTTLDVPPLRERPEDIPMLIAEFLTEAGYAGSLEALFPAATLELLKAHRWPGNVRELRNMVEAALATGEAPSVAATGGKPTAPPSPPTPLLDQTYGDARQQLLNEFERQYLSRLVDRAEGNVSLASRMAQVDRTHLIRLLKRHGLH